MTKLTKSEKAKLRRDIERLNKEIEEERELLKYYKSVKLNNKELCKRMPGVIRAIDKEIDAQNRKIVEKRKKCETYQTANKSADLKMAKLVKSLLEYGIKGGAKREFDSAKYGLDKEKRKEYRSSTGYYKASVRDKEQRLKKLNKKIEQSKRKRGTKKHGRTY